MRRTIIWTVRMVLVTAISLFAFGINQASAQLGGEHGGGIHVGSAPAYHGGFSRPPAYQGSFYNAPVHNSAYFHSTAYSGRNSSRYNGGFNPHSGYGWVYPFYDDGDSYPYTYSDPYAGSYSYPGSSDVLQTYFSGDRPQMQVLPTSVAPAPDTTASIIVHVPDPNAEVTVDGNKTTGTGTIRYFRSPPLEPGNYSYQLQATWTEHGQKVNKVETVKVGPGGESMVNFFAGKP